MKLSILPLLLLAACTAHDARDGAPTNDTFLSVRGKGDTDPATSVWFSIQKGNNTWMGGQTGGVIINTKSGTYVVKPSGITLMDVNKKNIVDLYALTLGANPGDTGRGYSDETGRTFRWTVQ